MYIKRHLETTIEKLSGCCKVLLVTGPRQVGKTTLLRRLAEGNRTYVTMDDINVRSLAMTEPGLFLQRYKPPLLIDEIQMAPKLLPYIKMYVDEHGNNGDFWLTGSHAFDLMENVTESLAGRIAIVHLLGFSHAEVAGLGAGAFVPEEKFLLQRAQEAEILPMRDLFGQIWRGSQLYRQYDQLCGAGQGSGDHCANGEAVAEGTGSGGAGIFTGAVHASEFKIWCESAEGIFYRYRPGCLSAALE